MSAPVQPLPSRSNQLPALSPEFWAKRQLLGDLAICEPPDVAEFFGEMTKDQLVAFKHDWHVQARDAQLEELLTSTNWQHWLVLAGRFFGKTRLGAEWVRKQMTSGNMKHMALVHCTPAEARKVMIEGESGILAICTKKERPKYYPALKKLVWPNGGVCEIFSAEKPDGLRGHQCDGYWCDELAAWRFLKETWDMLMMGFRLSPRDGRPRGLITTTPRPLEKIKDLARQAIEGGNMGRVYLTRGKSTENAANIPASRMEEILEQYAGTRLGRQELDAEILEDDENALWSRGMIRYVAKKDLPIMAKIVVGVDPQKVSHVRTPGDHGRTDELRPEQKRAKANCETGIVIAGKCYQNNNYVLDDRTIDGKPEVWAKFVCDAFWEFHAESVIAEANAGGDMVAAVILNYDPRVKVELVNAARGQTKYARALPISTLYERGKVFHWGTLPFLEDQMCTWNPNVSESPDRIDALVWALWHLSLTMPWDDGDRSIKSFSPSTWGG